MNLPQNINLYNEASESDITCLKNGIVEFNETVGPMLKYPPYEPVHLILKEAGGRIIGGLLSKHYLHCIFIEILWVDGEYRKDGFGSKLLSEIEFIARERQCKFIHLDTFSFQAIDFYKKYGYEVFAQIDDFPDGIVRYFLKKYLI